MHVGNEQCLSVEQMNQWEVDVAKYIMMNELMTE